MLLFMDTWRLMSHVKVNFSITSADIVFLMLGNDQQVCEVFSAMKDLNVILFFFLFFPSNPNKRGKID